MDESTELVKDFESIYREEQEWYAKELADAKNK
jgi:hypothetical protein